MPPRSFHDPAFHSQLIDLLGYCHRQAAQVDEVLGTVARIVDGDSDSWLNEWMSTAGTVWAAAIQAEQHDRGQAVAHYRRAATYYAAALLRVLNSSEPERRPDIWRRQRACWERMIDLAPGTAERLAIAYEGTTLPGFFFPATDAAVDESRPLIIINNRTGEPTSQAWVNGGAAAAARGYHWMTFDGPGFEAALVNQGLLLRPDWEAVLTPVVDAMLSRPDVDPSRIAVLGVGMGGYLAVRAICFEHRLAAAVADPGVVDASTAWTDALSDPMRRLLKTGARTAFEREVHLTELFAPDAAACMRLRGAPFGLADGSWYALYQRIGRYRLAGEIEQIRTPVLVLETDPDQPWRGQSRRLYDRLPGRKCLIELAAPQDGDLAGAQSAASARETRIYEWLEQRLGTGQPSF
ncbi:MAG TPA: hypothetical protein VMD09_13355 [Solirubrobacteraceae bacterium]|nr:hypothetical protein [Solirubrobacteraceae bacterium]